MLLQEIYRALIKPVSSTVKKKKGQAKCYGCDAGINPEMVGFFFSVHLHLIVTLTFARPAFRFVPLTRAFPLVHKSNLEDTGFLITRRHL